LAATNPKFWRVLDVRARLGEALLAEGRLREGIAELEAGYDLYTATIALSALRSREIASLVASYYDQRNATAVADRWHQRAESDSAR